MNALANYIQANNLTGTPAEIVAALGATIDLPQDHTRWTYNGVADAFGEVAAEGIAQAINATGLTTAVVAYASVGFDLANQKTQDQLTTIAAAVPALAGVCNSLKAIGRPTALRWQAAGFEDLPSEAEVTDALAEIAAQQAFSEFLNECVQPALSANGATVASIKAAVAAFEG